MPEVSLDELTEQLSTAAFDKQRRILQSRFVVFHGIIPHKRFPFCQTGSGSTRCRMLGEGDVREWRVFRRIESFNSIVGRTDDRSNDRDVVSLG